MGTSLVVHGLRLHAPIQVAWLRNQIPHLLFSFSVMFNSLKHHGLQHTRLPCPLPFHGVCSNSYPSNHLILYRPLLLPSILPSNRVFSSELPLCIRWPKYWSFRFNISPSSEYSGLISFRIDCLDLLAVQRALPHAATKDLTCHNEDARSCVLN